MARLRKLPPLPPLPVDAWQPRRAATTSSVPPESAAVRKRVLPHFVDEEESTVAGQFDLNDPRLFPSDRPPAPDQRELEDDEATIVDGPSFEPLRAPLQTHDGLDGDDQEALTAVYAAEPGAPIELPKPGRRPRLTALRVALAIYVVALLAQTLVLVLGADELVASLLSAWHRWFG